MYEEDRGHHAGLPERRPPRDSRGFAGRGPKGYQRSDDRIREDICERLTANDDVDASDVTVAVRDGEVTLEGSVVDRRMRRDAEACADEVIGVREIHNRLQARATAAT
jgi:osmotically-inducible protein OsmY